MQVACSNLLPSFPPPPAAMQNTPNVSLDQPHSQHSLYSQIRTGAAATFKRRGPPYPTCSIHYPQSVELTRLEKGNSDDRSSARQKGTSSKKLQSRSSTIPVYQRVPALSQ